MRCRSALRNSFTKPIEVATLSAVCRFLREPCLETIWNEVYLIIHLSRLFPRMCGASFTVFSGFTFLWFATTDTQIRTLGAHDAHTVPGPRFGALVQTEKRVTLCKP
jgi:hypothetical protein